MSLKVFIDLAAEHNQSRGDYYGALSNLLEPIVEELQHVEALMHTHKGPGPTEVIKGGAA